MAKAKSKTAVDPAFTVAPLDVAEPEMCRLRHDQLVPDPDNPRKEFDKAEIASLAASIHKDGQIEPLLVRPDEDFTVIVAGERRWRAMGLLIEDGRWPADTPILCVKRHVTGSAARVLALVENIQRVDLNAMEEAEALKALKSIDPKAYTNARLAELTGKTERWVELRLALVANLAADVKKALRADKIKLSHARELATVPQSLQARLSAEILKRKDEVTADELRGMIEDEQIPAARAMFDVAEHPDHLAEIKTGKKTERVFIDRMRFMELQKEAVKKLAKELRAEWAWVETTEHFYSYDWKRSDDKAKAGVVIEFEPRWRGEVKIHKGLVKDGGRGGASAPKTKEERAKVKAAEQKRKTAEELREAGDRAAAALSRKLVPAIAADATAALRVLSFMLLKGYCSTARFELAWGHPGASAVDVAGMAEDVKHGAGDSDDVYEQTMAMAEPWADLFKPWLDQRQKGGATGSETVEDRGRLWDAIGEISDREMPKFVAALVAQDLKVDLNGQAMRPKFDPAIAGAAALVGIPVPEDLLEFAGKQSETPSAVKPKGKTKAKAERRSGVPAPARPKNAGDAPVFVKRDGDGVIVKVQTGEELPAGTIVLQPGAEHFTETQVAELQHERDADEATAAEQAEQEKQDDLDGMASSAPDTGEEETPLQSAAPAADMSFGDPALLDIPPMFRRDGKED